MSNYLQFFDIIEEQTIKHVILTNNLENMETEQAIIKNMLKRNHSSANSSVERHGSKETKLDSSNEIDLIGTSFNELEDDSPANESISSNGQ